MYSWCFEKKAAICLYPSQVTDHHGAAGLVVGKVDECLQVSRQLRAELPCLTNVLGVLFVFPTTVYRFGDIFFKQCEFLVPDVVFSSEKLSFQS